MADERLGPEILSTRGVPSSRRGYDKRVMDGLLSEAARHWESLADEYDRLRTAVEESGGLEFLVREMTAVAHDVERILVAAKEAADGLRARAQRDADELADETEEQAELIIVEAEAQAFELRRDAWESGIVAIDSAVAEAAAIVEAGRQEVLLIRAQAEQESHRMLGRARKEADDIIRTARFEADRQLNQAREVAQQIIDKAWEEQAEQEAPESSEPVAPGRRRELLEEIERLRSQRSIEAVEVFETEPASAAAEPIVEVEPDGIDLSDELAAEVEQLRESQPADVVRIRTNETVQFGTEDDVGTLFEALRTTDEVEVVAPDAEQEHKEDLSTDPFELRDQLILPVLNEGAREAKRLIVEFQNVALDGLRGDGWSPDAGRFTRTLRTAVEPSIHRAASAGATAAGPLADVTGAVSEPGTRATGLAGDMAATLVEQLERALESGGGPEMEAASVSRVFREWRTDTAERWLRRIAFAAYHDSLLAALRDGGVDHVVGVASGSVCEDCPGRSRAAWPPGGPPADGTAIPPAHIDCACTFAPAVG